jgi:hypothetical protein
MFDQTEYKKNTTKFDYKSIKTTEKRHVNGSSLIILKTYLAEFGLWKITARAREE